MKHKVDIDENLVEAQRTRRIIDRLVGYKISKVLWITLQKNMNFVKQSLSAGRVQSAALKIIIDRERRRAKFKKVTYFGLTAQLMTEKREAFNAKLLNMDFTLSPPYIRWVDPTPHVESDRLSGRRHRR